jgi:hypothetical protein
VFVLAQARISCSRWVNSDSYRDGKTKERVEATTTKADRWVDRMERDRRRPSGLEMNDIPCTLHSRNLMSLVTGCELTITR